MTGTWTRLLGTLGIILLFFGGIAAIFFHDTFLAPAAYIEIALGLLSLGIYLFKFFGEATKNIWRKRDSIVGGFGALIILLILIGVNVIANSKLGEKKLDLTTNKLHSLTDDSVKIVKELKEPVEILSFVIDPRAKALLRNLVEKYTYQSSQIKFKALDPDTDPTLLEKYSAQVDEIVFLNPKTEKTVKVAKSQISEQEFTTAIRRCLSAPTKAIYFLQGLGEPDLEDDKSQSGLFIAKLLLEREGFQVRPLQLATALKIPDDAGVIVEWGAKNPAPEAVVKLLENYLKKGGKLVMGLDPMIANSKDRLVPSSYTGLLGRYGLELGQSILVQVLNFQSKSVRTATVIGMTYSDQAIVKDLGGNLTQFSVAQPVLQSKNFKDSKVRRETLVSTGEQTNTESNIAELLKQTPDSKPKSGLNGPHPIAQIAETNSPEGNSSLVVFGDADFALNGLIQSQFNRDLFLNIFGYLLGTPEAVSLRPKQWRNSTLEITVDQKKGVYFASIFVLPQLIILFGLAIWSLRRSRR
ncbi:MAG: hypothetical protein COV44_08280 [Deltaproteobacteria bacterium CG11_big_fil_rev_8_21_14_0_20_45_16]|nr:MAG: hypothetical protein COV44_08280 [Deltaproteobacteria bacterium CG11_big_fil_rev_8_21_14_0_20_45_16]